MNGTADAPWTVSRLLAWTRDYLQQRDIASPRLCAEVLLAHAMGCERLHLFTQFNDVPAKPVLDQFRAAVREAATGKPIAYIVGSKDFFSMRFAVTPDVLIPRPETETLVERVISLVRAEADPASPPRILDVGCGSGCICISLAKHLPDATIFASDVSEAALNIAKKNAETLGVADRIDFRLGSLFEPWRNEVFTCIVSNPPYIPDNQPDALEKSVRDHEPHTALFAGNDGLAIIRPLVDQSPRYLTDDGELLLEIAFDQAAPVTTLFDEAGWPDVRTYKDMAGHDRIIHARRIARVCSLDGERRGIVA
ncbi:MAG: peptide chain release factor N(5)-glutamine methyltransferase [Phycisphaerae bacterium]